MPLLVFVGFRGNRLTVLVDVVLFNELRESNKLLREVPLVPLRLDATLDCESLFLKLSDLLGVGFFGVSLLGCRSELDRSNVRVYRCAKELLLGMSLDVKRVNGFLVGTFSFFTESLLRDVPFP